MNVATIVTSANAAALPDLDQLAEYAGVNIAFEGVAPKSAESLFKGQSSRLGLVADLAKWASQGMRPLEALPLVKDRLMMVRIVDLAPGPDEIAAAEFLLAVGRLDPVEAPPWPPKCGNCGGPHVPPGRPLFISLETTAENSSAALMQAAEEFESAVRPAMGYRIDEIARQTPISDGSMVHPEQRKKIEAALPRRTVVKPLKSRTLLVVDVTPNAYYHATCANGNLALELMGKYTGAYTPVFSNDLSNLKYPTIRKYDAVFLNCLGGGEVFADPDVLNGLLRFVRGGGGVAGLHGSTYASLDLPEYGEMMGGQDGSHRCCETSTIKIDDPASPLTRAFGGNGFSWYDEFYHFPDTGPFSRQKSHVLISIDAAKTDISEWKGGRADNEYPVSWIKSYGKGRVFNLALGHTPTLFMTPVFGEYVLAGIQFVLGDLQADTSPSGNR